MMMMASGRFVVMFLRVSGGNPGCPWDVACGGNGNAAS